MVDISFHVYTSQLLPSIGIKYRYMDANYLAKELTASQSMLHALMPCALFKNMPSKQLYEQFIQLLIVQTEQQIPIDKKNAQ